ncbi:MAG: zinc ABC transporter substrate-binding protein, partial [Thermoanaerobaculia bacterium]|nr:zinc ABC transporter substrate-binding protein [Thermoanaerobaculia bacterium]
MLRTVHLLALTLATAGPAAAARPIVAVSVAPQRGIVERIAGGSVEVVTLIPAGTDVESYAPSAQQMARLERAALVFFVGHRGVPLETRLIEPWLERHPTVPRVTLVDDEITAVQGHDPAHRDGAHGDPHLWLSPRLVRRAAAALTERLAHLLPAEATAIRVRGAAFDAEIAALDARLRAQLAGGGRFLIDHPSLGHLGREYGLEQVALEHDGKEPTPAQLARLVAQARRDGYRVVLAQRGASRRGAELLARETGAELVEIDPLAPDWL